MHKRDKYPNINFDEIGKCPKCGGRWWVRVDIDGNAAWKCIVGCGEVIIDIQTQEIIDSRLRVHKHTHPSAKPVLQALGRVLMQAREAKGMSRAEVATLCGRKVTTVTRVEHGTGSTTAMREVAHVVDEDILI